MNAHDLGKRLAVRFGARVRWSEQSPKRLYVSLDPEDLYEVFDWLRESFAGFRLGTSTAIDLREGIGVFHHCCINGESLVVTLKVLATKPDPHLPSLAAKVPSAAWIEREMNDLTGVRFDGHPDARRLVKAEAYPDDYPLRRDFDVAEFKERIGEQLDY